MRPTAQTVVAGVVGDPVRHSLSPLIHNAAFAALGIDGTYVAFPVSAHSGNAIVSALRCLGIVGLSVTMPHKEVVAATADEVSSDVALLGAANTLVNRNGVIRAEVTDGQGCVAALRASGFDPEGRRCLVLGAGGAGRAVALSLARAGARELVIVNRGDSRAERTLALVGRVARRGSLDDVREVDLIVNATPIGMGTDELLPLDPVHLSRGQFVNDLVYHPLETPLLKAARVAGAQCVDGLGMLVYQAGLQFEIWTGQPAPIRAMRDAVTSELQRRAKP